MKRIIQLEGPQALTQKVLTWREQTLRTLANSPDSPLKAAYQTALADQDAVGATLLRAVLIALGGNGGDSLPWVVAKHCAAACFPRRVNHD